MSITLTPALSQRERGKLLKSPCPKVSDEGGSRWCSFGYDELIARDKTNLDYFGLKNESLEDSKNRPRCHRSGNL